MSTSTQTVATALVDENERLRKELADARKQIEILNDDIEEAEREQRCLRDEIYSAEANADELQDKADRLDRLGMLLADLADLHDIERHPGPQRFCSETPCRVFAATSAS